MAAVEVIRTASQPDRSTGGAAAAAQKVSCDSNEMTTSPCGHATPQSRRSRSQAEDYSAVRRHNAEFRKQRQSPGGEVGTPLSGEVTPPSHMRQDGSSEMVDDVSIEEHRRVLNKMRAMGEELDELRDQVKWMEETSAADVRRGKNAMMNMRRSLTQTDHRNLVAVKLFCRNKMYCNYKRLPPGWAKYSDNPKTPCARIMKEVITPSTTSRVFYWNTKVVSYVSKSYSELAGTDIARLLKQYRGEFVLALTCVSHSSSDCHLRAMPLCQRSGPTCLKWGCLSRGLLSLGTQRLVSTITVGQTPCFVFSGSGWET